MNTKAHGIAYRIWNQMRLAKHVDSWLQVCQEFVAHKDRESWCLEAHEAVGATVHGLRQSIIVHLDMIKARQGVSLYALVDEAYTTGRITKQLCASLHAEINQHSRIMRSISRQRNNLVAHRSPSLTFKQVTDSYPVSFEDMAALSETYYSVALQLHQQIPFQNPWQLFNHRSGARLMLQGLNNTRPSS